MLWPDFRYQYLPSSPGPLLISRLLAIGPGDEAMRLYNCRAP
jgi:hypothetical protein